MTPYALTPGRTLARRLGEAVRALVPGGVHATLDVAAVGADALDTVRSGGGFAATTKATAYVHLRAKTRTSNPATTARTASARNRTSSRDGAAGSMRPGGHVRREPQDHKAGQMSAHRSRFANLYIRSIVSTCQGNTPERPSRNLRPQGGL
jgi:hypothetical protein